MSDQPFYALIIPQSGPGVPTHPIAPGGQPPRPWGPIYYPDQGLPGNQPYPGQGLPGNQPIAGWGPGFPTPPIYMPPGGQPPRPWGPINYPDQGLPGAQPIPGWGPGFPTNPIAPGGQPPRPWGPINYPDQGLPQPPLGMWGPIRYPDQGLPGSQPIPGWGPGFPTNPIVIPPGDLPTEPVDDDHMVIVIYVPGIGYKMAVVPKPEMPPGYNPPTGPSTERPTPVER